MTKKDPAPAASSETAISTKRAGQMASFYGQNELVEAAGGDAEEAMRLMQQIQDANDANIGEFEIKVARLGIAQPLTPEVSAQHDGWKAGMLFDTMNRTPLSQEGKPPWLISKGVDPAEVGKKFFTVFLPIFKLPTEYAQWPTKEEKAADPSLKRAIWKTVDIDDPRVRAGLWPPKGTWNVKGKAPPVTETTNILGMCLTEQCTPASALIIASFSRTSATTGERLVNALNEHRMFKMPWWGRIYYLYTDFHQEQRAGNTVSYYSMEFAKGPKLLEHAAQFPEADGNDLFKQCFNVAKPLIGADGRELQLRYLSMSEVDDDAPVTPATGDGHAEVAAGATEDPEFATGE